MTNEEYLPAAMRTENKNYDAIRERLSSDEMVRLLHAGMGLVTEASEFLNPIKASLIYGKPLDRANLVEECSDAIWFIALALDTLGVDFNTVMQKNIDKLRKRYPEKFTDLHAINRDVKEELKTFEGSVSK